MKLENRHKTPCSTKSMDLLIHVVAIHIWAASVR